MGPNNTITPDEMAKNSETYFYKCMDVLRLIAPKSDLSSYTDYDYTALHCAAEETFLLMRELT